MTYTYEGISSRVDTVSEAIGTSIYDYDVHGHIKSYEPAVPSGFGQITYEWNSIGQKAAMTVPIGYGSKARRIEYSYDNTGRQTGMDVLPVIATSQTGLDTDSPSSQTRFFYDHSKKRVSLINKAGDVYYFVYDPTASVPAVVYEQGAQYRYLNVREPDGALISREKYVDDARVESRTYHFDGLGSTIALTDEGGAVTDTYGYDAWGNVTGHTGNTTDNPYQYVGQLGYYTHYQEPDYKLLQLGVRYYDPGTGRFNQRDPIKHGMNLYLYAGNRPVDAVDPHGLEWSLFDWFYHYWYGGGRAVSLNSIGLLDDFQEAAPVRARIDQHKKLLRDLGPKKAQSLCRQNKGRNVEHFFAVDRQYAANVTNVPKLLVIGDTTINANSTCLITVDCCSRNYRLTCLSDWYMHDAFVDAPDVWDWFERDVDLPGSTPYDIFAQWNDKVHDSGKF